MRRSTTLAMSALLILTLIVGAGNLWASWDEVHSSQAAQKRQGQAVETKLCSTFGTLAALKPPAGTRRKTHRERTSNLSTPCSWASAPTWDAGRGVKRNLTRPAIFGLADGLMSMLGVVLYLSGHESLVFPTALSGAISAPCPWPAANGCPTLTMGSARPV